MLWNTLKIVCVSQQKLMFMCVLTVYSIDKYQQQTAFENMVGKEEIAHNEQFSLLPQCFLLNQKIGSAFVNIFDIISLFAAELR